MKAFFTRRTSARWQVALLIMMLMPRGANAGPLDSLVGPSGAWPLHGHNSGFVLVMFGRETCGASMSFRPYFGNQEGLPAGIVRLYADTSTLASDAKFYPTPFFILFKDGQPVDFHVGVVNPSNSFAADANRRILTHLAVRNHLAAGDPWELTVNQGDAGRRAFDYRAIKFLDMSSLDLTGATFVRSTFTSVKLTKANLKGAKFEGTILAHVDLTDALIDREVTGQIAWVNVTCPDGTNSRQERQHL